MRTTDMRILVPLCAAMIFVTACTPPPTKPLPQTLAEYQQMGAVDRVSWDDNLVVQSNLNRVRNGELTGKQRIDSLAVVDHIATDRPQYVTASNMDELARLIQDESTPADLNRQVLTFLLKHNYANLAGYLVPAMGRLQEDPALRQLVLEYFARNPNRTMLAGIIRAWASEPTTTGQAEESYRNTVKQMSGQSWEDTLVSAMNTTDFQAKGETLEILEARMDVRELRTRIMNTQAASDTMSALQTFVEAFDYLPKGKEELFGVTLVYRFRRDMIPAAAKLALEWTQRYQYKFNVRDFHLLSRLERDPLRNTMGRAQLVLAIGQALKTRKHVAHRAVAPGGADDYKESFWLQVDNLTMADLWNLYLLDEMLNRPRAKVALRLLADRDLADTHSAWGGLVFYQNGQAEAIYYEPDPNAPSNDRTYQAGLRAVTDGRDALARFIGHFDRVDNADRAGPSATELADATYYNYYGVTITRTGERSFCVHYYTPTGTVVSLGEYQIR